MTIGEIPGIAIGQTWQSRMHNELVAELEILANYEQKIQEARAPLLVPFWSPRNLISRLATLWKTSLSA